MLRVAAILGFMVLAGSSPAGAETKAGAATFEELAVQASRDLSQSEGPAYHSAVAGTYRQKLAGGIRFCMHLDEDSPARAFQAVLMVRSDGTVSQVAVDPSTAVSKCIQDRLLRTRFPKPPFAPFHDLMNISFKQE